MIPSSTWGCPSLCYFRVSKPLENRRKKEVGGKYQHFNVYTAWITYTCCHLILVDKLEQNLEALQPLVSPSPDISADQQLPRQTDPWEWLLARPDICTCVDRLSEDDNDVYIHMQKLASLPSFSHVVFASKSCRGRKIPPGDSGWNHDINWSINFIFFCCV